MAIKIGINGFGRIGRLVFRVLAGRPNDFEVVLINDLTKPDMLATMLKYDSTHRRFNGEVGCDAENLIVNGRKIKVSKERDPAAIKWGDAKVDIVLESTGVFSTREGMEKHIAGGAPRVLLSAPAKSDKDVDATVVMGVNDSVLGQKKDGKPLRLVSNASCTTNCLAPMAQVLSQKKFGIVRGLMTTVHAYTNDQRILDLVHEDPRRARAAALNIIPTSTGAAKAVGLVIPELQGKLTGLALRVPVPTGSVTDLTCTLANKATKEEINAAMKEAANNGPLKGILAYTEDPIVSSDIIGDPHSCIFDASGTYVIDDLVKVVGWYDNEWGYSNRTADMLKKFVEATK